ncbi:hypothetical protein PIB30_008613 [Stylosanthes scabra]|uniref:RBR-type E3 ubiquitin transferase n=1 Tax=Stylosanthes scabra TaxID=79078 RepID=A0ABU6R3W9_9FABA|nr:hypothetical protein [Stylosanthes scabra]
METEAVKKRKKDLTSNVTTPPESSPCFECEICTVTKTEANCFAVTGCTHAYCKDCIVRYIRSKLDLNIINIRCPVPRCGGLLESESCRKILPKKVFDRWEKSLCESAIIDNETKKFMYCPLKRCSALMILGDEDHKNKMTKSKCLVCKKQICVQCNVAWHEGYTCEEFKKDYEEARALVNLAYWKKWRKCPKCKMYVEKAGGCPFMHCRCGNTFYYGSSSRPRSL